GCHRGRQHPLHRHHLRAQGTSGTPCAQSRGDIMTAPAEDRLLLLLAQNELTAIDFVYVHNSQTRLDVFFLLAPETLNSPLPGSLAEDTIRIENIRDEGEPDVPITH